MITAPAPPAPFRPALILPTYNNAATLGDIITRCLRLGFPTYVVDDGCTDNTKAVLAEFPGRIRVLTHAVNQGKASAIQTGFAAATADGCSHAVTVDTDGQLAPEQVPDLLKVAEENPLALILGARKFDIDRYPAQSRLGRRISNLLIFIESGASVTDSQCGLRVYPLGMINHLRVRAGRYGYETEVITRAAWARCKVIEVPISCYYPPREERVSHYRVGRDTYEAIVLHLRLILRSMSPWPHRRWPVGSRDPQPWWRRFLHWVNPMDLWRQARLERKGAPLGAAVAMGVFIANLPCYGAHALVCLYVARKLRLHPLGVLAGSLLSAPPLAFLLVPADIQVGRYVLYGKWPEFTREQFAPTSGWTLLQMYLREWTIGGIVLGLAMGLVTFALIVGLVHLVPRKKVPATPGPSEPQPARSLEAAPEAASVPLPSGTASR